LKTADISDTIY